MITGGKLPPAGTLPARGLALIRPPAVMALVAALMLASMILVNPGQVAAVLAGILLLFLGAGKLRAAMPHLKIALYAGAFLLVINPLLTPGGMHVLWKVELGLLDFTLTLEGVVFGISQFIRFCTLVMAFSLYSVVIDPDDQLRLMSRLSFRSGLVVSLATRLLPLLSHDAWRILDAQRCRAVELDSGKRLHRARMRVSLLGALIIQSLERACDLAAAMETRGYGRKPRSTWRQNRHWRFPDKLLAVVSATMAGLLMAALLCGAFSYNFFPRLDDMQAALADPWWLAFAGLLLVALLSAFLPAVKTSLSTIKR